ncbi:MAG: hypothetical protein ACNYPI_01305 [Arenicellales bacterium WSBS_2016_MAG_OTU3]
MTTTNVNIALSGSGTDYSLTVTPIGIGGIGIGGGIINVTANVFTDAANNGNPFAGDWSHTLYSTAGHHPANRDV